MSVEGSPPPSDSSAGRLRSHLESRYGIEVTQMAQLDVGVWRVERGDGPNWVARAFPTVRPPHSAIGDGEILGFLAEHEFPAERCATADPVSVLDGQGVLITEYVEGVPRPERQAAIRELGGLRSLGELLGRLHTLPAGTGAVARRGGAWHHLADGGPREELDAACRLLAEAEGLVPARTRGGYDSLRAGLEALDDCHGLPETLVHPDFVLANVVASRDRGLVLVDWAGAGRGARLWPLAFLLYAEGAKNLARVDLVVAGYRRHVDLEPEELSRLVAVMPARPVIFATWGFCMGRMSIADAAREVAEAAQVTDAVVSRARAAFAARAEG